jgi:hypothetical protein
MSADAEAFSDEDFKLCLDALNRAAENSRSTFFAYVVIFGALLVWALNAIIFPAEQQRIGEIRTKQIYAIDCMIRVENFKDSYLSPSSPQGKVDADKRKQDLDAIEKCSHDLQETSLDVVYAPETGQKKLASAKVDLLRLDTEFMQHQINYQVDRSNEMSKFNIPLIGVASDRTWLWLISMILGPLLYYIIKDSLSNLHYLLNYLYDRSTGNPTRLALLSMAQVITASAQRVPHGRASGGTSDRESIAKLIVLSLVLLLPVVLSILVLYDWQYLIRDGHDQCDAARVFAAQYLCKAGLITQVSNFFGEPEFWGGLLTIPALLFELALFARIIMLLRKLSEMHQLVRGG